MSYPWNGHVHPVELLLLLLDNGDAYLRDCPEERQMPRSYSGVLHTGKDSIQVRAVRSVVFLGVVQVYGSEVVASFTDGPHILEHFEIQSPNDERIPLHLRPIHEARHASNAHQYADARPPLRI